MGFPWEVVVLESSKAVFVCGDFSACWILEPMSKQANTPAVPRRSGVRWIPPWGSFTRTGASWRSGIAHLTGLYVLPPAKFHQPPASQGGGEVALCLCAEGFRLAPERTWVDFLNRTEVREFIFSGLTNNSKLVPFLLLFFLLVYLVTILGNVGIMSVVYNTPHLHTPMYYFLGYLSLVDLFYSTVVTPKMLSDLVYRRRSISFSGCALQLFFFAALAVTEALLLSSMSYDRYVAICHPLRYSSIMTVRRYLWLVIISTSLGFIQSSVQTSCVFSLQFCGTNLIDHFYGDIPPLLKLSCSQTLSCEMVTVFFTCSCGVGSFLTVLISYTLIVSCILRMNSAEGRRKAFHTCSSHLTCVSIFYGTVFFIYLRPPSSASDKQDKVVSVFYSVVIPMCNPLIYSLRNEEVKRVIIRVISLCSSVLGYMYRLSSTAARLTVSPPGFPPIPCQTDSQSDVPLVMPNTRAP
ncbi:olfactory receptor 5B21-like [Pelodytes ibericus]